MKQSPGHRKWPEHQVREERMPNRLQVEVGGEVVADSNDVIKVEEDDYPDRFYFPQADVLMDQLRPTRTTSQCPFKGEAHYFTLEAGGRTLNDVAWTYEDPYAEHVDLAGRIAFYEEKDDAIAIQPQA